MTAIRLPAGQPGATPRKIAGRHHGHSIPCLRRLVRALRPLATRMESRGELRRTRSSCPTVTLRLEVFERRGDEIAAIITEAAPANMGVITPPHGFNQAIHELAHRYGALVIFDEVLTGFRVSAAGFWGYDALPGVNG